MARLGSLDSGHCLGGMVACLVGWSDWSQPSNIANLTFIHYNTFRVYA